MLTKVLNSMKSVWPVFHRHNVHLKSFYTFTDYWNLWTTSIFILVLTALSPLFIVTIIHYQLIQKSVDSELNLRTERLTSNVKSSISFFMEERLDALIFTINEKGYEQLANDKKLAEVLKNLKLGFGGLTDLSVIDMGGNQIAYAGPYNLEGKNYKTQPWFLQSLKKTNFISEVFTGYRDIPHIIIAVKSVAPNGSFFILRATLDTERLIQKISSYKTGDHADIFLVNHQGVLQTASTRYGKIFTRTDLIFPKNSGKSEIILEADLKTRMIISSHSFISTHLAATPFILVVQKEKAGMMHTWHELRQNINWTVGISIVLIIFIITLASTSMVNKLYMLDETKAQAMLQMEQNQQLASIGQLAAGVAHEINNPLEVINQTAGYIKDLYSFKNESLNSDEIVEEIDSILDAVDRCGTITKQLLGFVRQFDVKIKKINLQEVVTEVLNFHKKEAEYKGVNVTISIPDNLPDMETDKGKFQQILVNLINNAFQAVEEGGCLDITSSHNTKTIELVIKDTGCGIPEESLKKIYEPFFSTKKESNGTGLGLSITYGLVKKLGGHISVQSTEGVGTCFTITLPAKIKEEGLV